MPVAPPLVDGNWNTFGLCFSIILSDVLHLAEVLPQIPMRRMCAAAFFKVLFFTPPGEGVEVAEFRPPLTFAADEDVPDEVADGAAVEAIPCLFSM